MRLEQVRGGAVCRGCVHRVQNASQRCLICGAGSDDDAGDEGGAGSDASDDEVSDGGGDADEQQHQQPAFNAAGSNALQELQSTGEDEELHQEAEQQQVQLEGEAGSGISEEIGQLLNQAEEGTVSEEHGEPGSSATAAAALPTTRCVPPATTYGRRDSKERAHWCAVMSGAGMGASASCLGSWPRVHRPPTARPRNHGAGAPALHACAGVFLMHPCIS